MNQWSHLVINKITNQVSHSFAGNTSMSTLTGPNASSHATEKANLSLSRPRKSCQVATAILPWDWKRPVLTEIIYGGSCVHVLIMLHVDDNVKVSLHVVSVAVALWPHDIRKGSEETKERTHSQYSSVNHVPVTAHTGQTGNPFLPENCPSS